jgi:hypothetical protein
MATPSQGTNRDYSQPLRENAALRRFAGPPKEFWPRYLACVGQLTGADKLVLLTRDAEPSGVWKRMLEWPAHVTPSRMLTAFSAQLDEFAARCSGDEGQMACLEPKASAASSHFILGTRLNIGRPKEECVLACLLSESGEAAARDALVRLQLAAGTPELFQTNLAAGHARADVERYMAALDSTILLNAEKRFLAGALAFCNGLATRFNCDRVSLGWLDGGYVRLRAISRTEKFDRQMAAAKALEVAMEEALDQDDEIVWPRPEGTTVVTRDHEHFAREQNVPSVCSLPLRVDDRPVAAITCERQGAPFSPLELQQLRLCCDLAARRLGDLKNQDRWWGARWTTAAREQLGKAVGPEHTWAKMLAILMVAALACLFFLKVNYRVEGNFLLRSDEAAYLTAPFEGYIDRAFVRPGDAVVEGARLLSLKTAELELEESAALADLNRYQREAEKARAGKALAEMRVAQALAEQAQARLDLLRYRIGQATLKAPFAGVVVEGDLSERLGAPVKQAEALLKMARIDTLYVEAEVNERDAHEILGRAKGEMAFVSQPKRKFSIRIATFEQAAVPKDQANVFLVRCSVEGGIQPWWRPGMSGVCKFEVEKRTLFWILTHRTVDFLRLKLWW